MRPKLEKIPEGERSFLCYEVRQARFDFFWHFHPEYELTYIVKGRGNRLVGDSIETFGPGDFVLLGPGLPHVWVSDKETDQPAVAFVIQFSSSFAATLLSFPEMSSLDTLFKKAQPGLSFPVTSRWRPEKKMQAITGQPAGHSLILLLDLLQELGTKKGRPLASAQYRLLKTGNDGKRIQKVLKYIQDHYRDRISVSQAAALLHLSDSAFCKYFKRSMGKTFSDYVNDIRITQATSLLVETDLSVSAVASDCGFENMSYFNRVFLLKKGIQPNKFRDMRRENSKTLYAGS
jgi:AraC-like DNA-binding protein